MNTETEKKKINKPIERVTINDKLKDKLSKLADQANTAMNGMAEISKSDIVNLLLDEHGDGLSAMQIKKLKATHIDEVKYAYWIAEQLKLARDSGQALSIQDLMARNQSVLDAPKKRRRKKSEDAASVISPEPNIQDSKLT